MVPILALCQSEGKYKHTHRLAGWLAAANGERYDLSISLVAEVSCLAESWVDSLVIKTEKVHMEKDLC